MAEVYVICIDDFTEKIDESLYHLISETRKDRIMSFRVFEDKMRCYVAGLVATLASAMHLGVSFTEIEQKSEEGGAPYAVSTNGEKVFLSLSHSGKYVTCIVDDHVCGIDVEKIINDKRVYSIAQNYFHSSECEALSRILDEKKKIEYFYMLWTLKEAYLKMTGVGLLRSLASFSVHIDDEYIYISDFENDLDTRLQCKSSIKDDYVFSVIGINDITVIQMKYAELINLLKNEES